MSDIIISTDNKKEEKPVEENIKDTLKAADEYAKLKEQNDRFEAEIQRTEELKQKMMIGGRALAGQSPPPEKTEKEKADEEAKAILSMIR